MNAIPIFRSIRDPIGSAARWAVHSVPAHLSARGLAVPVWAALLLPAIALLPLASPWASLILAPVFALAAGLRLAALVGLFLPKAPEPPPLADADLPAVTVLVPLFREAAVLADLVAAVARLDYPARLLEVMLLLEEADTATIAAARAHAPAGWRIIAVPPGSPQTKPRACNVGLRRSQLSAQLLAEVETAIRDVFRDSPLGSQIVPVPEGSADDMDGLRRSFIGRRGSAIVIEGVAQAVGAGMHPQLGKGPDQLSPDLSRTLADKFLTEAKGAIYSAFGILPGLQNPATTGPKHGRFGPTQIMYRR